MVQLSEFIEKHSTLFRKRSGRDKTMKYFWAYIRDLACFIVTAVVIAIGLPPATAFITEIGLLFIVFIFGLYSMNSMRLRMIEERIEANRVV